MYIIHSYMCICRPPFRKYIFSISFAADTVLGARDSELMIKICSCPCGASSLEDKVTIQGNKMEKVPCDLRASRRSNKQLWEWRKEK